MRSDVTPAGEHGTGGWPYAKRSGHLTVTPQPASSTPGTPLTEDAAAKNCWAVRHSPVYVTGKCALHVCNVPGVLPQVFIPVIIGQSVLTTVLLVPSGFIVSGKPERQ